MTFPSRTAWDSPVTASCALSRVPFPTTSLFVSARMEASSTRRASTALPRRTFPPAKEASDAPDTLTPSVPLSLMVFFALACQCMSTLAVVKRETGGYKWPTFLFVYMTTLAWVSSFIVFQGGRLLGFG
mgnify:CR=1 FL=1